MLAERLAARLACDGEPVVTVGAGAAFERACPWRFCVRPGSADDLDTLLATLAAEGDLPGRAVLLPAAQGLGGGTAGLLPTSLLDLLHLTHGLGRHLQGKSMRIALVTEALWDVVGGEVRDPDQAAAVGLARVIPQEHPNLRCRVIDVAAAAHGPDADGDALDALAGRLAADSPTNRWPVPRLPLRPLKSWPCAAGTAGSSSTLRCGCRPPARGCVRVAAI